MRRSHNPRLTRSGNVALLIISINSFVLTDVLSQTAWSLAPQLTFESTQSYVIDNIEDPTFRPHNTHFSPSFGLSIQMDSRRQWMYFANWSTANPVLGYKYSRTGPNLWRVTGLVSHRFSLGVQKTIGTHYLFRSNESSALGKIAALLFKNKQSASGRYLLLFRSRIISGVSYNLLHSMPGDLLNNGQNASVFAGLGAQFFNLDQDHLQINIIYSHGFREVTQAHVSFSYNNDEYNTLLGSRGSYLGVQLLYPLRISYRPED